MTPDDLARLKALAERWKHANEDHGDAAIMDRVEASEALYAALDLDTILALIEAATPVPAGEFGERLWALYNLGSSHANECDPELFVTQKRLAAMRAESAEAIAALTRSHATLLAERDAARAEARLHKDVADMIRAEREQMREALNCWPLKELLTEIEDGGTPESTKLMEKVRWFNEVRSAALAASP